MYPDFIDICKLCTYVKIVKKNIYYTKQYISVIN